MPGPPDARCRPSVCIGARQHAKKLSNTTLFVKVSGGTKRNPSLETPCFGCGSVTK